MIPHFGRWLAVLGLLAGQSRAADFPWKPAGPGVASAVLTNSGPVILSVVRIDRARLGRDLHLLTTLGSNQVVGMETLSHQTARLPDELGAPVAAINADFFMMSGAAKGDPRGVHLWRGELVSVPVGLASFWVDGQGQPQAGPLANRLMISWPGGGTNQAGLNEQLGTNQMVLFTPRMGRLGEYRPPTNSRNTNTTRTATARTEMNFPPRPGFIRPPGGREYVLEHAGSGDWLPLRVGRTYQARVSAVRHGFTNVPPGKMILMLGSNWLATLPEPTNGTRVTISSGTEPDISDVSEALGSGPLLVHEGRPQEIETRMSTTAQPRSAIGWNRDYFFMAVADGRQPKFSVGLKLAAMADFMVELGCEEAFNLDGGQSSTLLLNAKVINFPSDSAKDMGTEKAKPGREREVANGIVIVRRPEE